MQEFRPEHAYFNVRLNEGIFIADNKTLPMISGNFGAIIGKQLMLMPSLGYYVVPKQSWGSLIEAELAYQYKKMTPFIKYSFLRKHYKNTYYDHFGGKETYVDITSEFWLLFGLKYQINKPHKTVATMR